MLARDVSDNLLENLTGKKHVKAGNISSPLLCTAAAPILLLGYARCGDANVLQPAILPAKLIRSWCCRCMSRIYASR